MNYYQLFICYKWRALGIHDTIVAVSTNKPTTTTCDTRFYESSVFGTISVATSFSSFTFTFTFTFTSRSPIFIGFLLFYFILS